MNDLTLSRRQFAGALALAALLPVPAFAVTDAAATSLVNSLVAAIQKAVQLAGPGDIVLLAGKGHETYQEFAGGKRIPFDDGAVARRAIESKRVEVE